MPQRWLDRFHSAIKPPRPLPDIDSCCCWGYPKHEQKTAEVFQCFQRGGRLNLSTPSWSRSGDTQCLPESTNKVPRRNQTKDWCWGPHGACGDWPASWTKFKGKRVNKNGGVRFAPLSLWFRYDFGVLWSIFDMFRWYQTSKRCRMFGSFWMVPTTSYSRTCMPPYNPAPRLNWLPFQILSECLSAQNAALAMDWRGNVSEMTQSDCWPCLDSKISQFWKKKQSCGEKLSCLAPLSKSKCLAPHFYELLLKPWFHGFQASNSLQRCIFRKNSTQMFETWPQWLQRNHLILQRFAAQQILQKHCQIVKLSIFYDVWQRFHRFLRHPTHPNKNRMANMHFGTRMATS